MKTEIKSKYAEYIAKIIRESMRETGLEWPKETIICVKPWNKLSELDEIIGMSIWVVNIPTTSEIFPAFPSKNAYSYRLLKAFEEFADLFSSDLEILLEAN